MKKKCKIILKNTVFKLLSLINQVVPKDENCVLLYIASYGLRHNHKPLFNYMIMNGYNKRYKVICSLQSKVYYGEKHQNVKYVKHMEGILFFFRAGHVFYTAGQIPIKPSNNQIVIHMNHGTTDYKVMGALVNNNYGDENFFTYINAPSDYYRPIVAKEYKCSIENVIVCNEPMTDAFYEPIYEKYDFSSFKKTILWLPTFRQSDGLEQKDSLLEKPLIIFDERDFLHLNEKLKALKFKLIVKLHTAQALKDYHRIEMSNLSVISSEEFMTEGHDLYQLLMQTDALIGDYSSVNLQYLLLDKPLVYVIPDIEEYKQMRGFVFDNPEDYMPGYKVRTKEEFFDALNDFSTGVDRYKSERERIRRVVHKYNDGDACKRVLELSKMNL